MEKKLFEMLDKLEEAELTPLLQGIKLAPPDREARERICAEALAQTGVSRKEAGPRHAGRRSAVGIAVCLVLLAGLGAGLYTAEAREYGEAVQFFAENGLSTEGLARQEIRAVYRDISTSSFSYAKTAEVIQKSLRVEGHELPLDAKALWDYKNSAHAAADVGYRFYSEEDMGGGRTCDIVEKVAGDKVLWRVALEEFWVQGTAAVKGGVLVYGQTPMRPGEQTLHARLAKIEDDGTLAWKKELQNGFKDETIEAVLEDADGSYAVFSRGELRMLCLNRFTAEGDATCLRKTDVGNVGVWNAVHLDDGYLLQLGSYRKDEHTRIVRVDRSGRVRESFSYDGGDEQYYIEDMIEFGGRIYLSGYAVPKLGEGESDAGGRAEIAAILSKLDRRGVRTIASEELSAMLREHYTALLLACDPVSGTPGEFYTAKGGLGGRLAVNAEGDLSWEVGGISGARYSPLTSAYSIRGWGETVRYTFAADGTLKDRENTGQTAYYAR